LLLPYPIDIPTKPFSVKKVRAIIKNLNLKKAPSYDLIINQILQKLSEIGIKFIILLCNAVLRRDFFPMESSANYYDSET